MKFGERKEAVGKFHSTAISSVELARNKSLKIHFRRAVYIFLPNILQTMSTRKYTMIVQYTTTPHSPPNLSPTLFPFFFQIQIPSPHTTIVSTVPTGLSTSSLTPATTLFLAPSLATFPPATYPIHIKFPTRGSMTPPRYSIARF